jgi:hypothetical protein
VTKAYSASCEIQRDTCDVSKRPASWISRAHPRSALCRRHRSGRTRNGAGPDSFALTSTSATVVSSLNITDEVDQSGGIVSQVTSKGAVSLVTTNAPTYNLSGARVSLGRMTGGATRRFKRYSSHGALPL